MLNVNNKIFNKIFNKILNNDIALSFISSNSGTGKSTYFKWLLIRRALKGKGNVDFFFRYENELQEKFTNERFLTPPSHASNRLRKLCESVEISVENGMSYLIEKESKRKIGQGFCINMQKKYKSDENPIQSKYAFFDEVLADDGRFCNDECYKFSRLIDTRSRSSLYDYKVISCYNKIFDNFIYKEYFKNSPNVLFYDFTAKKIGLENQTSLTESLSSSNYSNVFLQNENKFYKQYYKEANLVGCEIIIYIYIDNKYFSIRKQKEYFFLKKERKCKKNKHFIDFNSTYGYRNNKIYNFLNKIINRQNLFSSEKKYTYVIDMLYNLIGI